MSSRAAIINWSIRHGVGPHALAELEAILGTRIVTYTGGAVHPSAGETAIWSHCRLAVDQWGGMLLRNNSGVAREVDDHGAVRHVRYGLGNDSAQLNAIFKSSDGIGIAPGGRFLAVEAKPKGWKLQPGDKRAQAQNNFIQHIRKLGGVACFATDPEDVAKAINL